MTATHRIWWFPDNTVLCNFAAVDRLSLLEKVLDSRGRWTQAVAYEATRSARHLPRLRTVLADGWLGRPIEIDDPHETELVDRLRRLVFAGDPRRPLQHLGEAETLTLIQNRPEFAGSVWITDDGEAGRFARRKGITVLDTVDIVRAAVAEELVVAHEGHRLLHAMTEQGRHLRGIPPSPEDLRP
ncbi:hypothetical protein [Streptomyces sp. PSAA01]|uniref:hypothetical protein n=1 Tax=Streptomyces sp. PSAA01 TaxID=2912762 RepID=UPI001F3712D8|nr:hypothetical protein [Streptomyces sp. PSAA01]MCG0285537.1 hypothetical protein [Streptomyces sp. PSAA01]